MFKCLKLDYEDIRDSDYNMYKIEQNNYNGTVIVYH